MNKNKGFIGLGLIIAIVLGVIVIGGGAYYLGKSGSKPVINPENILPNNPEINQNQNLPADNNQQINVANPTHSSSITVLSPNGGEVYKDTDKIAIKWNGISKDRVAIYLRFSTGEWCEIKDVPSSSTNYTFTPYGHDCGPGRGVISGTQKYKITLIAYKNGGMAPEPGTAFATSYSDGDDASYSIDSSDNYFSINSIAKTISTTDWKVYRNNQYGFELKYPNDWKFSTSFSNADGFFFTENKSQNGFTLAVLPKGEFDHGYSGEPFLSDTQISGKQVKISNWNNSVIYQFTDNTIPSTWIKCGLDLKNCNRIEIQGSDQLELGLINQILSTFKFIN